MKGNPGAQTLRFHRDRKGETGGLGRSGRNLPL